MHRGTRFRGALLAASLVLAPFACSAEMFTIVPRPVTSSGPVEQALRTNKGHATTAVEGKGGTLRIAYQASEPLTITMVPVSDRGAFVPTDFLIMTLPATAGATADVDLTVSQGWSPASKKWVLHVLTKDERTDAGFTSVEFLPAPAGTIISAAVRHFLRAEPYSPSSYHALRGYRVLTRDVTIIAGVFMLAACAVAAFLGRTKKLSVVIAVLLGFQALYGLRFGLDLLRFSAEHLRGYAQGLYDEAGSVHRIASSVKALATKDGKHPAEATVFVCRSGTNYKEKILRYAAYPVVVTADPASAATADMALVMDAEPWRAETVIDGNIVRSFLACGDLTLEAEKISDFPDGSVLFSILT